MFPFTTIGCQATKWPYREMNPRNIYKILTLQNIRSIRDFFYYELTATRPVGIQEKLYNFLINSAKSDKHKALIYALQFASTDDSSRKRRVLNLQEVCQLERKVN